MQTKNGRKSIVTKGSRLVLNTVRWIQSLAEGVDQRLVSERLQKWKPDLHVRHDLLLIDIECHLSGSAIER